MLRQEDLREIASILDRYLGIETRKSLMAGNEQLMMGTSPEVWNRWLVELRDRLAQDLESSYITPVARQRCVSLVNQIVNA